MKKSDIKIERGSDRLDESKRIKINRNLFHPQNPRSIFIVLGAAPKGRYPSGTTCYLFWKFLLRKSILWGGWAVLYAIAVLARCYPPQPFEPTGEMALVGKSGGNCHICDGVPHCQPMLCLLDPDLPQVGVGRDSDRITKDPNEVIATQVGEGR